MAFSTFVFLFEAFELESKGTFLFSRCTTPTARSFLIVSSWDLSCTKRHIFFIGTIIIRPSFSSLFARQSALRDFAPYNGGSLLVAQINLNRFNIVS